MAMLARLSIAFRGSACLPPVDMVFLLFPIAAMGARAVRQRKAACCKTVVYREARARGYSGDRIVLMGASLGTGVAIALAVTHKVAALVLEAPYLSALDIAFT